jgi:hypothetical protein
MARKSTKADMIAKMFGEGYTSAQIRKRLKVSESYVHAVKKKLAAVEAVTETKRPMRDIFEKAYKKSGKGTFLSMDSNLSFTPKEVGVSEETFAEVAHQASQGKDKPKPEPEVSVVDKVLDAREDQYGSFMQGADIAVRIKGIMHNAIARKDMHLYPDQLLALDMIAVKISRIVNGNASHRDSWLDIAGYAKLVADRLGGISR